MKKNNKCFSKNKLVAYSLTLIFLLIQVFVPVPAFAATSYEAENATLSGGAEVAKDHTGYSGKGFAAGFIDSNMGSAAVQFNVKVSLSGNYKVTLRYANGTNSVRTMTIYVNDKRIKQTSLIATENWDSWGTVNETLALKSGSNTIKYKFDDTDNGNVNIDSINVTAQPAITSKTGALANGVYRIRSQWQASQYLYEDHGEVAYGVADPLDKTAQWVLTGSGNKKVLWNVSTGNYISITKEDDSLKTAGKDTSFDTKWTVSANGDEYYNIQSAAVTNRCINIKDLKGYTQCNNTAQTSASTQWIFEYVGAIPVKPALKLENVPTPIPDPEVRGAVLPFTTYETENADTNGTILKPDRSYHVVQSEASGRSAVRLDKTGDYVEFTLTKPANSIVIRYSMPDAAAGGGITAPLSLYVDGAHTKDITLTSKYAWQYGAFPWTNSPSGGSPHRFFDETRFMTGNVETGTKIRLQKDAGDNSPYYIIDLIDMEQVAPALKPPPNSLSITSFGAKANDGISDVKAINDCIKAAKAQNKEVWIPEGTFDLPSGPIKVNGVTIRGAGMWYSVLSGRGASFALGGSNSRFYDFSMTGGTAERVDSAPETGFDGNAGIGSIIENIWLEHLKCGVWVNSPTSGLKITGCRIRDTFADGINICGGSRNCIVTNNHFRNTGDDSIAVWSASWISPNPCSGNIISYNTIQSPWLANGIAIYGGSSNTVEYNLISDIVAFGAGINVSSNFEPVDFRKTTNIHYNTIIRGGSYEWDAKYERAALWINVAQKDINASININSIDIYDSTYQGIMIEGPYKLAGLTTFSDINIKDTGTYGIEIRNSGYGSAEFKGVHVTGSKAGGLLNSAGDNFVLIKGADNSGW